MADGAELPNAFYGSCITILLTGTPITRNSMVVGTPVFVSLQLQEERGNLHDTGSERNLILFEVLRKLQCTYLSKK